MGRRYVRHRLYMVRPVQAGSVKPRRPVSTPGRTPISENLPASRKDKEYGILISWGGDDVARDSGAGLLLDVPPVTGGDLVYFFVECGHVLDLLLILIHPGGVVGMGCFVERCSPCKVSA